MLLDERVRLHGVCVLVMILGAVATQSAFAQPAPQPINPGDLLYIEIYRVPELTTTYQVDDGGNVNLAYVGPVKVAGLSETDASAAVAASLGTILRNPRVTVSKSGVNLQQPLLGRTPDMRLELVPLHNADAANISQALHGMTSPGGNIGFDPDTNTLIITDTAAAVQNIMHAVTRLDQMQSQLTQVRIEAKIAEVRVGAMKEMGIRWFVQGTEGLAGFNPPAAQDTSTIARRGAISPFDNERIGDNDSFGADDDNNLGRRFVDPFTRRLNVPVQVPLPGQSFLGFFNEHLDVGMLLDALVTDKDAELLANPMTLTVNHNTASIKMIDEFPFTEFGTEITGATNFSTQFLDLGIQLEVTPHVYEDDGGPYVKMEVIPEVSFPVGSSNGVPIRSVRRTETVANVRSGQTLVIGGIMQEEERVNISKIPGLGNLPLIGRLFKHSEKTNERTELMIFVTPTIHRRPEEITWDHMIDISDELRERALRPVAGLPGETRKD